MKIPSPTTGKVSLEGINVTKHVFHKKFTISILNGLIFKYLENNTVQK